MPTQNHRVQVLLSPDLLSVVTELSEEKGLSMGKTCSLLVREALLNRGLLQQEDELGTPTHRVETVMEKSQKTDHSELSAEDMKLLRLLKAFKEMN